MFLTFISGFFGAASMIHIICTYLMYFIYSKFSVFLLYRNDKCKLALEKTQGIKLFGSKIKVTPLNSDG